MAKVTKKHSQIVSFPFSIVKNLTTEVEGNDNAGMTRESEVYNEQV